MLTICQILLLYLERLVLAVMLINTLILLAIRMMSLRIWLTEASAHRQHRSYKEMVRKKKISQVMKAFLSKWHLKQNMDKTHIRKLLVAMDKVSALKV